MENPASTADNPAAASDHLAGEPDNLRAEADNPAPEFPNLASAQDNPVWVGNNPPPNPRYLQACFSEKEQAFRRSCNAQSTTQNTANPLQENGSRKCFKLFYNQWVHPVPTHAFWIFQSSWKKLWAVAVVWAAKVSNDSPRAAARVSATSRVWAGSQRFPRKGTGAR